MMDALTAFGLFAVTLMLVTYALEDRSPWFILAFAGRLRARLGLRLPAGRLAVRRHRGDLGRRGGMAMGKPAHDRNRKLSHKGRAKR